MDSKEMQRRSAKKRWSGLTKAERSAAMKALRAKAHPEKQNPKAGRAAAAEGVPSKRRTKKQPTNICETASA